jgi:CheY-like chemotaxis protein
MSQILVVDDDRDVCHLMVRILKRFGYEADCATSGQQALQTVQSDPPKLILLDVMMPEMSGMEVLKRVRESNPEHIPIIMFSALSDASVQREALSLGADDFWVKASMDIQEIVQGLRRFLPSAAGA